MKSELKIGHLPEASSRQEARNLLPTNLIIFSDYDGTLADHGKMPNTTLTTLQELRYHQIPLVLVTSRSFSEVREILVNETRTWGQEPFIFENGAAIALPDGFLDFNRQEITEKYGVKSIQSRDGYVIITLARPYSEVRDVLKQSASKLGLEKHIVGIGDMSDAEFAQQIGVTEEMAVRAKARDFQEGFQVIGLSPEEREQALDLLKTEIENHPGFSMFLGGIFSQIMADSEKGKAMRCLIELFKERYKRLGHDNIVTLGFGDAPSDIPLLKECHYRFLVGNPKVSFKDVDVEDGIRVKEIGAEGFNKTILALLSLLTKNPT